MKRLNPRTQTPFKRGDIRADGYIFNNYSSIVKKDGYFKEIWLTKEALERRKLADTKRKMKVYCRISTRLPKGTSHYFKQDKAALVSYKKAISYMKQFPDYSMEHLKEITYWAPYVLKIIFPPDSKPNYQAIFAEVKDAPSFT